MSKSADDREELTIQVLSDIEVLDAAEEVGISASYAYELLKDKDVIKMAKSERDRRVIEDYLSFDTIADHYTYTLGQLEQRHQINRGTVYNILKRHNIKKRTRHVKKLTPEEREAEELGIISAYQDTEETIHAMSLRLRRSVAYIYSVLDKYDIPRRRQLAVATGFVTIVDNEPSYPPLPNVDVS